MKLNIDLNEIIKNLFAKRNERIGLEVLQSILQTNNPISVLTQTIDFLYSINKKSLAQRFEYVKEEIELEAKNILDAFFDNWLISEETYYNLKAIDDIATLKAVHIENEIERQERQKEFKGKLTGIIAKTAGMMLFTISVASPSMIMTKNFTLKALKDNDVLYGFYYFLMNKPVLGTLTLLITILSIEIIFLMLYHKSKISLKESLFKFASYVYMFRMANVPYYQILDKYIHNYFKEISKIPFLYEIKDTLIFERASNAFKPLLMYLDIKTAIIFNERLSIETSDIIAWKILTQDLYKNIQKLYSKLESISTGLYYLLTLITLIIAFYPLANAIYVLINKF
jgi:hypothetical protein